jgi:processive 1,2-diacylglycerol beta-glucosyltransferase
MRILVLTLSFGSGHVRAAEVIARELKEQAPDADVLIVDALAKCRALFRAGYVWPYWAMVRYAPGLWARFFAGRVSRMDRQTAPAWAFRFGCPNVFQKISEFRPDLIVATEVAACELAVLAKSAGLTNARIVNVITDHEAEPVWVKPGVEEYAVADESVRSALSSWGAPTDKILVCGIPTDPGFNALRDKRDTKSRYRLRDDSPVVLLMGGGMGPTHIDEVAAFLLKSGQRIQIVAIAGRDRRMRRRLDRLRPLPRLPLRIIDWTDDVAALMQLASVLITKPGGLTIAEAAVCGLPLVLFDAIPGPEQRNAARLVAAGAAMMATNAREAANAALTLIGDEHMRRRMSACATRHARPEATAMIVRLALADLTPARLTARGATA